MEDSKRGELIYLWRELNYRYTLLQIIDHNYKKTWWTVVQRVLVTVRSFLENQDIEVESWFCCFCWTAVFSDLMNLLISHTFGEVIRNHLPQGWPVQKLTSVSNDVIRKTRASRDLHQYKRDQWQAIEHDTHVIMSVGVKERWLIPCCLKLHAFLLWMAIFPNAAHSCRSSNYRLFVIAFCCSCTLLLIPVIAIRLNNLKLCTAMNLDM